METLRVAALDDFKVKKEGYMRRLSPENRLPFLVGAKWLEYRLLVHYMVDRPQQPEEWKTLEPQLKARKYHEVRDLVEWMSIGMQAPDNQAASFLLLEYLEGQIPDILGHGVARYLGVPSHIKITTGANVLTAAIIDLSRMKPGPEGLELGRNILSEFSDDPQRDPKIRLRHVHTGVARWYGQRR